MPGHSETEENVQTLWQRGSSVRRWMTLHVPLFVSVIQLHPPMHLYLFDVPVHRTAPSTEIYHTRNRLVGESASSQGASVYWLRHHQGLIFTCCFFEKAFYFSMLRHNPIVVPLDVTRMNCVVDQDCVGKC
jgi:hypothetical protein